MGKIVVVSAPSGAGKTSIVRYLLDNIGELSFSVSSCSREIRAGEEEGKDYYFLSKDQFQQKIEQNAFLEWEEVYTNQYYGTLISELHRVWDMGKIMVLDIDVIGGINIKNKYSSDCLSIFIMPPSIDVLRERLCKRGLDSEEDIIIRLEKSQAEIRRNQEFDRVILNDDFEFACKEAYKAVIEFIEK